MSPSFARGCFTETRTLLSMLLDSRVPQSRRCSDSEGTTRPASTERMRGRSYSVAVSVASTRVASSVAEKGLTMQSAAPLFSARTTVASRP